MEKIKKLLHELVFCAGCPMNIHSGTKGLWPCGNGTCYAGVKETTKK